MNPKLVLIVPWGAAAPVKPSTPGVCQPSTALGVGSRIAVGRQKGVGKPVKGRAAIWLMRQTNPAD